MVVVMPMMLGWRLKLLLWKESARRYVSCLLFIHGLLCDGERVRFMSLVDLDWPRGIFAGMPDLVISKSSSISSCVTYGGHIGLYSAWMDGWMDVEVLSGQT